MTKPNSNNSCAGHFHNWLEVVLTDKCNGKCSWCVERGGYHPKNRATLEDIAHKINTSGKENIILLGGEPLLYKGIKGLISCINNDKNIYITTNGSLLTAAYVADNLAGVKGINISIHHYNMRNNEQIVGLFLNLGVLKEAITQCYRQGINIRFNCNCIKGYIGGIVAIDYYIEWAKSLGVFSIRFAELKNDSRLFVNLADIFNGAYGLNNNPYTEGCYKKTEIAGCAINFRQMCGLQTPLRERPENPECIEKKVLYYDGNFYDGWQLNSEDLDMDEKELRKIIRDEIKAASRETKLAAKAKARTKTAGKKESEISGISKDDLKKIIREEAAKVKTRTKYVEDTSNCHY